MLAYLEKNEMEYQQEQHLPIVIEHKHFLTFHQIAYMNGGMGVFAELVTFSTPIAAHQHDFWELAFAVRGYGQHEGEQECVPLLSGDIWIIRPGQWHAYPLVTKPLSVFNLLLTNEFIQHHQQILNQLHYLAPLYPSSSSDISGLPLHHLHLSAQALDQCCYLLTLLEKEQKSNQPYQTQQVSSIAICTGLVLQLLGLLDRFSQKEKASASLLFNPQADAGILAAVQFIEEHFAEPLTLEEIAYQSGYAPSHLTRKFRQHLGTSPINYLLQIRLQRACLLLKSTESSISAIALQTGFSDSRYFATRFRQVLKMTPTHFRDMALATDN